MNQGPDEPESDTSASSATAEPAAGEGPGASRGAGTTRGEVLSGALADGIGGRRGMIDSALPILVFVISYIVSGSSLMVSLWAAVLTGLVVMVVRLVRGESLRQVFTGFAGVAVSAVISARTGQAEDFFLLGLSLNVFYSVVFLGSILVRHPVAGYASGAITGDLSGWRRYPGVRRAANQATWVWIAMFVIRLVVQLPLYFAGAVGALGAAKIAMGVPLFIVVGILSYRIMRPAIAQVDPMLAVPADDAPGPEKPGVASEGSGDGVPVETERQVEG